MREFNSNEDIYTFANEIITQAKTRCDVKVVKLLQSAIERGGLLPSERLGELRLAFEELCKETEDEYLILLRSDIQAAIRSISKSFKMANRFW